MYQLSSVVNIGCVLRWQHTVTVPPGLGVNLYGGEADELPFARLVLCL